MPKVPVLKVGKFKYNSIFVTKTCKNTKKLTNFFTLFILLKSV